MIVTQRLKQFDRPWRYTKQKDVPYYWLNNEEVPEKVINDFIDYCMLWCIRKFGYANGLEVPELDWDWNHRDLQTAGVLGIYDPDDNFITIRVKGHRTFYNLAKTIVHEYVHYLQPRIGNWYDRYYRKFGYYDHPYEKEAYYLADIYGSECARWSMHQIDLKQ